MKIFEVVHTERLFEDELKEDYLVVYEETVVQEIKDLKFVDDSCQEIYRVTILSGDPYSTLQKINDFFFSTKKSNFEVRRLIQQHHPEILNKALAVS